NLTKVNSIGLASHHAAGVDVINTGDSSKAQTAYFACARHLSRIFKAPDVYKNRRLEGNLETLDAVAKGYNEENNAINIRFSA
ncbi:hypothetical protein, partial [Pseudomonas sp. CCI2.4]|uniref:hypothetical protein n=1 Tax=Pseudomonas sp. CCI2.4 TaxID=3048617 RepID=UPI002B23CBFC